MIKRLARYKIYVDRARWYLVLIQFFMIAFIYLKTMGIELEWWYYPILVIVILGFFITVGFLDKITGVYKEELRYNSINNPVIQEILERLNKEQEDK